MQGRPGHGTVRPDVHQAMTSSNNSSRRRSTHTSGTLSRRRAAPEVALQAERLAPRRHQLRLQLLPSFLCLGQLGRQLRSSKGVGATAGARAHTSIAHHGPWSTRPPARQCCLRSLPGGPSGQGRHACKDNGSCHTIPQQPHGPSGRQASSSAPCWFARPALPTRHPPTSCASALRPSSCRPCLSKSLSRALSSASSCRMRSRDCVKSASTRLEPARHKHGGGGREVAETQVGGRRGHAASAPGGRTAGPAPEAAWDSASRGPAMHAWLRPRPGYCYPPALLSSSPML